MKKFLQAILFTTMILMLVTGCAQNEPGMGSGTGGTNNTNGTTGGTSNGSSDKGSNFDAAKAIKVVSREDGSGTRGAFIELLGIEEKGDDGTKKDLTTKEAIIARQTDIMMTTISGDDFAIGYCSLGSLNDTVKAVAIGGVASSTATIKDGSYPIARPFHIATKGEASGLAKDFIDFILSAEGQQIVSGNYISVSDDAAAYSGSKSEGKLVVAGSSSVTPVMEKLKEAYVALNPKATIEIQQSDSSSGMNGAIDGTCDIGMASRHLKESELEVLTPIEIALDGIAVIVNNGNPIETLTEEQVKSIFIGESTAWDSVMS